MSARAFIKSGYVWCWVNNVSAGETGFMAWREAGLVEALLWKLFKREPKP